MAMAPLQDLDALNILVCGNLIYFHSTDFCLLSGS